MIADPVFTLHLAQFGHQSSSTLHHVHQVVLGSQRAVGMSELFFLKTTAEELKDAKLLRRAVSKMKMWTAALSDCFLITASQSSSSDFYYKENIIQSEPCKQMNMWHLVALKSSNVQ